MVDLKKQYKSIKKEVDSALVECMRNATFINGPQVTAFQKNLEKYLGVKHVIPCANGTDALQIAMMALDLKPGDEVIVPAFTYVATIEVIALLGLTPVMVDVNKETFNSTAEIMEKAITSKTKAIVPVHLFGQSCDMEAIMQLAVKYNLFVIEDNAQAIGADYTFLDGRKQKAGTIGQIGCTSFFPAKNLGCYGDGGALMTNDDDLAQKVRMIANHGQNKRYYHKMVGVNSRLDSMQAAILEIKLRHLDKYSTARQKAAEFYDTAFEKTEELVVPKRQANSTHVFHQYTLLIKNGKRDALQKYLSDNGIPSMIYYPIPLYKQEAFKNFYSGNDLPVTEILCAEVLSLPMHTELTVVIQKFIANTVIAFFK